MSTTQWQWYNFDELSTDLLYRILRLRSLVFVVEQDCAYLDMDMKDQEARHLVATQDGSVIACARVLTDEQGQWIGRIVTDPDHRGSGLGHEVMRHALSGLVPQGEILMHAQCHLDGFYSRHGFQRRGDPFLEDGIPHVLMVRSAPGHSNSPS